MVNWCFRSVLWIPRIPLWKGLFTYLYKSQTTGPQTTSLPLVEMLHPISHVFNLFFFGLTIGLRCGSHSGTSWSATWRFCCRHSRGHDIYLVKLAGWNVTQLYWDFIKHDIRIPSLSNQDFMESKPAFFVVDMMFVSFLGNFHVYKTMLMPFCGPHKIQK